MKVMVIIKANKASEAGEMPSEQLLTEMGNFTRTTLIWHHNNFISGCGGTR